MPCSARRWSCSATSASCSKYPTTSDKAKDWRLRRDAFQAATQVKLPKSSSYQPPEAIPKASATDETSSSVFELRWTTHLHDWSKVMTSTPAGAVKPLMALASKQLAALNKGGFTILRSTLRAAAEHQGSPPLVGMRLREKIKVGPTTHTDVRGYPVRLGQGLVHRRIYLAIGTGAAVIARNEWLPARRRVRSELMLVDLSAIGHGYPAAEVSFRESYVVPKPKTK